jgi:hypothetical protein
MQVGGGDLHQPITYYASDYAASFSQGVLVNWFDVVVGTRPVRAFLNARVASRFGTVAYEQASYYLDRKEIWARSYLQFIAQNSGDTALKTEFRVRRLEKEQIGDRTIRVYWTRKEFAPIEHAMKVLFRHLEWM